MDIKENILRLDPLISKGMCLGPKFSSLMDITIQL